MPSAGFPSAEFPTFGAGTDREPLISIESIDYHRNGISGEGFWVAIFTDETEGRMVATVFAAAGAVAVLHIAETVAGNIRFGQGNSWRGDYYEAQLRAAIRAARDETGIDF